MEQTVQKQRVAVYCRIATDSEDYPASLATQEAYYTGMVGQRPDWELAGIYTDKGIFGADRQHQKEFKKMLTACKQGKIDIILVKSISRFARRTADCLETVRMLKAHGVGVIFEMEGIDTRMESGELHVTVFNELARMESESLEKSHGYPCRYGCVYVARRER